MSSNSEYGTPARDGTGGEVVDLAAAREGRAPRPETPAPDRYIGPDTPTDTTPDARQDPGSDDREDAESVPGEVLEGEVVPGTHGPHDDVVLVDGVEAQRPTVGSRVESWRNAERLPIVPSWMRSREELTSAGGWALTLVAHTSAYHALRVPKYAAKVGIRAPRGAFRLVGAYNRWLFDLEGEPVRQSIVRAAVTRPDEARVYERLAHQRDRRVRWRSIVTGILAVAALVAVVVALFVPGWALALVALVGVGILGVVGAPADRPLLDTAVVRAGVTPLTSDQVVEALGKLRIVGIDRAIAKGDTGRGWFPAPITREGAGWRADVELPAGVIAAEVVDKRQELAAALARPLGCVWPEVNAEIHPGRMVLFVADKDMSSASQKPWALLKSGTVDLFKPIPLGTDPRGRMVTLTLMFASMIVGSVPRMGKTFTLRLLLLAACLDPRAWVLAFDLKGTGDLSPTEPCAHRYRSGDDDEDVAYAVAAMREMRTELRRRTKVIRELPRDICPESKVTPALADRKSLGLHPVVIGVDECQVWFEHSQYGAELTEICVDLVKRGPAVGITLILATQRPDAGSIPPGVSANAVLRFCLKVLGWRENDMVLGSGMHGAGIRATMFARRDRGIGYLSGEGDDPVIARTFYVDAPAAEKLITRARTVREKTGNITGHAAGVGLDTTTIRRDTLLEDIAAVLPDTTPKAWSEVIVERLSELRPELYSTLTKEQLPSLLGPFGVKTGQVWGTDPETNKGANRRGVDRADILKAITKRDAAAGA